jgi:alpha-galactosidase
MVPRLAAIMVRASNIAVELGLLAELAFAQGLALTAIVGWNSWNHFAGKVTDADVRTAADAIASTGMKSAGYIS